MSGVVDKISGRFFYGWIIVAVSFLCWLVADAFGFYTFGLFIGPLKEEFGWTTLMITGAMTTRGVIAAGLGPLIGYLADKKYGARILMTGGVLAAGATTMAVSQIQSLWQFYLLYGFVGALGMIGFGGLVTHTIIAKWFILKRGRAMGMASMGVSISGTIFVPLVHFLITNYGWRTTLLCLGLIIWAVALIPVALLVRRSPEDVGLRPDGLDAEAVEAQSLSEIPVAHGFEDEYSWTLGQALRTRAMWLLLAAFNLAGLSFSGVTIHFFAFIESKGIPSFYGAAGMTTIAIGCAIVKVPWGMLAEKFPARFCLMIVYAGCAAGLAILLGLKSGPQVFLFAIIYGTSLGGVIVLRELLFADYYGRAFLGTIRGVVMPVNLVSIAGGPLLAAWIKDYTGSYVIAFTIFLITFALGSFLLVLARPPVPEEFAGDSAIDPVGIKAA